MVTDKVMTGKKQKSSLVHHSQEIVLSNPIERNCESIFDNWPSSSLSKNIESQESKYQNKPWLVRHYEEYISQQVKKLNVPSDDGMIQIYRNVFDSFINTFQSYRPLLSKIKQEYEQRIAQLECQVAELIPLKSMLITVAEECNNRIIELRREDKNYVETIKQENSNLYAKISNLLEDQNALNLQVNVLKRQLAEQYSEYRDEVDARRLLVADLNELKQQHDNIHSGQGEQSVEGPKDDVTILQISLRQAKSDLDKAHGKIHAMIADYTEVVPRRDFEEIQRQLTTLTNSHQLLTEQTDKLREEHMTLTGTFEKVLEERNLYYSQCLERSGNLTPRPDWGAIANYVPRGSEEWLKIIQEKSSKDIFSLILTDLSQSSIKDDFEGQGVGENIPAHLRFEGKIKRLAMSEFEVNRIAREFWHYRFDKASEFKDLRIDEIFLNYMKGLYPDNTTEACYSFANQSKERVPSHKIGLLEDILTFRIHENVFHRQVMIWEELKPYLRSAEDTQTVMSELKIKLNQLFTSSSDDKIAELEEKAGVLLKTQRESITEESSFVTAVFGMIRAECVQLAEQLKAKQINNFEFKNIKDMILSLGTQISENGLIVIVKWIISTRQAMKDANLMERLGDCYLKDVPLSRGFE